MDKLEDIVASKSTMAMNSGGFFDFDDMRMDDINIEDIATGLANTCRFNGQTNCHYSVAQHSVLVAIRAPIIYAYEGLMHDAHEYITGDKISPVKHRLPDYIAFEKEVAGLVRLKFGLHEETSEEIHEVDLRMLATEKRDVMNESSKRWAVLEGVKPYSQVIVPWTAEEAKALFLEYHERLIRLHHTTVYHKTVEILGLKL